MKRPNPGLFSRRVPIVLVVFLLLEASVGKAEEESFGDGDDFDEELYSVIHSVRDGSLWAKSRQVRSVDVNQTTDANQTFSDNSLWNDLWYECRRKASFSCVRTGVFKYLDKSLERTSELSLTDSVFFRRNKNKVYGFCENSEEEKEKCLRYNKEKLKVIYGNSKNETEMEMMENEIEGNERINADTGYSQISNLTVPNDKANEVSVGKQKDKKEENKLVDDDDDSEEAGGGKSEEEEDDSEEEEEDVTDGRSVESLSDLSEILYDKGTHFLMTHDMEVSLPQLFFGGGSIKIEPKSYIQGDDNEEEGALVKIVFKPPPAPSKQIVKGRVIHHLKKLFKKKLMHSFMALMLIIKMIKVKLMFLLPLIIGKATAKKLLLKVLLFLIPGLAHLFKLCHYYHQEHAKYHHHHHKIKHHHHHIKIPVPVPVPVHVDHSHHLHHGHIADPGVYDSPYGPSGGGYDYPPVSSAEYSHPGGDNDYDYGGGQGSFNKDYGGLAHYGDNEAHLSSWGLGTSNYHEAGVLDAKNQPASYYNNNPYGGYYGDHVGSHSQHYSTKLQALPPDKNGVSLSYDPFYSPILQRVDNIFAQLGFNDEPCRERLICSMYKTPQRFSPHSNLLSHEISRDARELKKPVMSNTAVLRFYRYVQAARDGQDGKDCLRLYPSCAIVTE